MLFPVWDFFDRRVEIQLDVLAQTADKDFVSRNIRLPKNAWNEQPSLAVQGHWDESSEKLFASEVSRFRSLVVLLGFLFEGGEGDQPQHFRLVFVEKDLRLFLQSRSKLLGDGQSTLGIDWLVGNIPKELHASEPFDLNRPRRRRGSAQM